MDGRDDGCMEKGLRWWKAPVLVLAGEFQASQMTSHACHGDIAGPETLTEVEVERIVLDVLVACVVLKIVSLIISCVEGCRLTVVYEPPAK
jgi:hypothetical protein